MLTERFHPDGLGLGGRARDRASGVTGRWPKRALAPVVALSDRRGQAGKR